MRVRALLFLMSLSVVGVPAAAAAADCPGNPDALGTSRVLVVDPVEHARIGSMQYRESLPLADHEVVLTFDDGPLPPYSTRILETLASQCVHATYFLVGRMARAYPETVRKIYEAGHNVGTHTMSHPYTFNRMAPAKAHAEMDDGIAAAAAALGDPNKVAPFFRIPGLIRAEVIEKYMAEKHIQIWSTDFLADDWKHLSASEVMKRALTRLEQHGKGILLLHDIQPATAMMLPRLLQELKRRGYKIVQVVPATPDMPKTPTTPEQWLTHDTAMASLRDRIPLPPIPPWRRAVPVAAPAADAIDVVPPIPSRPPVAPATQPASGPAAPATPATNVSPGPHAEITDVTGAIRTDAGPATTANMPKAGIP